MAMYDNANTVEASFNLDYILEYLLQAQWAELIKLKKVISEYNNLVFPSSSPRLQRGLIQ